VKTPPEDVFVLGAPAALREALINLIFNAVDALPRGGWIRMAVFACEEHVVVRVSDSGEGIPAEIRERIFEPFFSTKGSQGTGLGLAVVAGILERHAGTIALEPAPAGGTAFIMTLPRTYPSGDAVPSPTGNPACPHLLVVDDDPALANMVRLMLQQQGCTADMATDVEAALTCLKNARYEVLITDLGLGDGLSGWDLAREVQEHWPETKVLLATGWGAAIDVGEASARGVHGVLSKPYRMDELWRAVQAVQ
jgi:CheY-like chemotaxis protein/anti-sigma regulatory factor (Ser/Thr protein kinase)